MQALLYWSHCFGKNIATTQRRCFNQALNQNRIIFYRPSLLATFLPRDQFCSYLPIGMNTASKVEISQLNLLYFLGLQFAELLTSLLSNPIVTFMTILLPIYSEFSSLQFILLSNAQP